MRPRFFLWTFRLATLRNHMHRERSASWDGPNKVEAGAAVAAALPEENSRSPRDVCRQNPRSRTIPCI